jgi:hypothetical protein
MSRICILICRRDEQHPDHLTQLAAFDLPASDLAALQAETTLDDLEASTQQVGHAFLRQALVAQWEALDALAVARYRAGFPAAATRLDGHAAVSVASRFGTLSLRRQQVFHTDTGTHVLPGNALLPLHAGMITTRGLQEWCCLFPQDLSFAPVARLLGWQTQEPQVLSSTTVRRLVRTHGVLIRRAEEAEVVALGQCSDRATLRLSLVLHHRTRHRAGGPPELSAAVDAALAREQPRPPEGVSWQKA